MSNNKTDKIIKFLNGKFFYVVLSICFIAIGIAAWSGVKGAKINENFAAPETSSFSAPSSTPLDSSDSVDSLPDATDSDESIKNDQENTIKDKNETAENETTDETDAEKTGGTVAAFFIKPVLGEIMKNFSDSELQYSETYGDMRLHSGIDLAAEAGTAVMAAGEGIVTDVYTDSLWGSTVVIDHGNNVTVKYCGLNALPTVKKGDIVSSSSQIGTIDVIPCESVEKRHLHLEFYLNDKAVNPANYFSNN